MPKLILGFVGPLASGKGTCCQYLKNLYGAKSYRFSTMLRDILTRIYLPITRSNLQLLSQNLRNAFGDDALALTMAREVTADSGSLVTVDGIRRQPDIKHLRRTIGFHLIAVTADERVRFKRLKLRRENADDERKTFADFVSDGKQEAEQMIAEVVNQAEFTINNDATFEELYRQLDDIVRKLT